MRIKTIGKISTLIVTIVLVLAFVNKNTETTNKKPRVKRKSGFYNGVNEKPKYSRSDIKLSDLNYRFTPVLQGDKIEHDFFITNNSQQMIEFKNMKSCCGFILTGYSPRIFPGEEGKISVIMFTDKFGGQNIRGNIYAGLLNNEQKDFNLAVSVFVKKIASVSQHKIILKGSANQNIEGFTSIVPESDQPFKVIGIKAKKGLHIDYSFRKIEKNDTIEYLVLVKNIQKKPRVYRDMLFVQTDNPKRPEIRIRVEGRISE